MTSTPTLNPNARAVLAYYEAEAAGQAPKPCAGLTLDQFRLARNALLRTGLLERTPTGRYRTKLDLPDPRPQEATK
jgi:hypothetical protein